MSFNIIAFLKTALANKGAVPVADDNPLPVGTYVGAAVVSGSNPMPVAQYVGGVLVSGTNPLAVSSGTEYETVAASQTAQVLGATGATGDYLAGLLVIPATTSPGNVLLLDNATSITVFVGGAASLVGLAPFFIQIGAKSVSGAWKVTTGLNVSVIGVGDFT